MLNCLDYIKEGNNFVKQVKILNNDDDLYKDKFDDFSDPFSSPFSRIFDSFNMNNNLFSSSGNAFKTDFGLDNEIKIDFEDKGNSLIVKCKINNLKGNNVDIKIKDGNLTISGTTEKTITTNNKDDTSSIMSKQHSYQHFERTVSLPVKVEAEPLATKIKGDNLTITLKKI